MRKLASVAALALAACTDGYETAEPEMTIDPNAPLTLPVHGHQITTPTVTIAPGEEKFFCYATSLPSSAPVGVKSWSSKMTKGSHHMIVFASDEPYAPDGTVKECPGLSVLAGPSGKPPIWAYGSQEPVGQLASPPGVGVVLGAAQHLIVNLHYLNASAEPLAAHATINVETYGDGEAYVPASAIATYSTTINVPPKGTQTVEGSCAVPPGSKLFAVTTHSHRYTKRAVVLDGDEVLADTKDWEHPAVARYGAPFRELKTNKLTYRCDYANPTEGRITTGESAEKNEMCMGIAYLFPASKAGFCVNSFVLKGRGS